MSAETLRRGAAQIRHDYNGGTDTTSRGWLAVADWLDECANFELHLNRGVDPKRDEQRWKPHQWKQALTAARAYLGESA